MTNAEYFLKDGVDVEKIAREIDIILQNDVNIANAEQATIKYFNSTCKPTLTEDEKVILRNIDKNFKYIARVNKQIQVCTVNTSNRGLPCDSGYLFTFNHLFQFIKEGEEYSIKELLNNE